MGSACPSCKGTKFEVIDAGRLARCSRCRWLLKPTADGGYVTAIPQAVKSRPARSGDVAPFDHDRLDRILRGG